MNLESEQERRSIYAVNVALLREVIAERRRHVEAHPECPAAPLCCGSATATLGAMHRLDPDAFAMLMLTAIGELSAAWLAGEESAVAAMRIDADLADARGALDDLRSRVTQLEVELTEWNAAADALYPGEPA